LARNGLVYIEHTFDQPNKFAARVIMGGQPSGLYTSLDVAGHSNDITIRHSFEQNGQDSLVRLLYRISYLYRSCRLAVRRIVSSGMDLPHQRAGGVFLCLESLETRETRQS
jgi:hypothetical protein